MTMHSLNAVDVTAQIAGCISSAAGTQNTHVIRGCFPTKLSSDTTGAGTLEFIVVVRGLALQNASVLVWPAILGSTLNQNGIATLTMWPPASNSPADGTRETSPVHVEIQGDLTVVTFQAVFSFEAAATAFIDTFYFVLFGIDVSASHKGPSLYPPIPGEGRG